MFNNRHGLFELVDVNLKKKYSEERKGRKKRLTYANTQTRIFLDTNICTEREWKLQSMLIEVSSPLYKNGHSQNK